MYYLHFWKGKYPYQMEYNIKMKSLYSPRDVLSLTKLYIKTLFGVKMYKL